MCPLRMQPQRKQAPSGEGSCRRPGVHHHLCLPTADAKPSAPILFVTAAHFQGLSVPWKIWTLGLGTAPPPLPRCARLWGLASPLRRAAPRDVRASAAPVTIALAPQLAFLCGAHGAVQHGAAEGRDGGAWVRQRGLSPSSETWHEPCTKPAPALVQPCGLLHQVYRHNTQPT